MYAYEIREYITANGTCPFREWLAILDTKVRARVQARVMRFEQGNLGDHKNMGDGIWEARLMFGSGYRIYYALEDNTIILLLHGGDKQSQGKDIRKAKQYWHEYCEGRK